jgi:DNA-binding beta-propeller fold protein YncE
VGSIAIPGDPLTSFDISYTDQASQIYALADRSNAGVDLFSLSAGKFIGRAEGFVGLRLKDGKPSSKISGPNGVVMTAAELWAGDGDSTVKIFDRASLMIIAAIPTGGTTRLDEMESDPADRIFIGVNNSETPPFATLISEDKGHRVIGRVVFSEATDGAEQPAYNPADGLFYVSIPELAAAPGREAGKGGVAVIDPKSASLKKLIIIDGCHPTGLAFGPEGNFALGCAASGDERPGTPIINAASGKIVAVVEGIGGADMVDYNAHNGQYYAVARYKGGAPMLHVIDATTNKLVQSLPLPGGGPHSVTSSEVTGEVYVPIGAVDGGDGTVHVFAPQ